MPDRRLNGLKDWLPQVLTVAGLLFIGGIGWGELNIRTNVIDEKTEANQADVKGNTEKIEGIKDDLNDLKTGQALIKQALETKNMEICVF